VFLDEADPHGSPLGGKGTGEPGIQRHPQRDRRAHPQLLATPDKLLAALETLDGKPSR
jgi:hypothetical protein